MPVIFKDLTSDDLTATAGYLKFLPWAKGNTWLGALFIMNVRGEPLEFAHTRVCPPNPLLWRADIFQMRCQASLSTALFKACPIMPDMLFCLAAETHPGLFGEYLRLEIPIVQVASGEHNKDIVTEWITEPDESSQAGSLLERLIKCNLLLEPFERAGAGLREVYAELLDG